VSVKGRVTKRHRMDRIDRIQIFGERCSGTNYIEHLLKQNLRFIKFIWPLGWKHSFCPPGAEDADNCLFIVIHRNPLIWVRSLHQNPWHAAPQLRRLEFSDFIRHEWWCIWDEHAYKKPDDPVWGTEMMEERSPETGERFSNVLRMRTAKIKNWTALKGKARNYLCICYEDLRDDPEGFIARLSEEFRIKRRRIFSEIHGEKGGTIPYREKSYPPICDDDMEFILTELDMELEQSIGYDLVTV
jgi:hypothetical protein